MRKYFYFFFFINLIKQCSCFITLGNQNAKLRVEIYVDMTHDDSGTVIQNFFKALEKSCLQVIESSIVFIKIYPVSSDSLYLLTQYLNQLESISPSFDECRACSYKKFVKMSNYFRLMSNNSKSLINQDSRKVFDQLHQIFMSIDEESLTSILNDTNHQAKYYADMASYNSVGLKSPILYINSVHIDEAVKYSDSMWSEIFKVNSSEDKIKCEDYEDFINRLNYY